MGNALLGQGRYPEAEASYRQAMELDPNFALLHSGLGSLYQVQGCYQDAIAQYQRALGIDPNNSRV